MMTSNILEVIPSILVKEFINQYSLCDDIDIDKAMFLIKQAIKYHKKEVHDWESAGDYYAKKLQDNWYKNYDYSVYADKYYFTDLWLCWQVYSRNYLRSIRKSNSLSEGQSIYDLFSDVESVVDLGCGIGYTTIALKDIFPNAKVYGTNVEKTPQYDFCEILKQTNDFTILPSISSLSQIDLVFASEYFEHIKNPIEHLQEILSLNPKYLYIANSFNTYSVGHFLEYDNYGEKICQTKISRMFNDELRKSGYKKLKTNLWNNKPAVWVKI